MATRSNPFEEFERLVERMSRQFEDATRSWESGGPFADWRAGAGSMPVDMVERDDEYVVTVDLPGYEREEVDVEVTDHVLRIAAEKESEREESDENYLRHERSHAATRRSIRLPEEVQKDGVSASMNNGVLTVTLPKLDVDEARKIDVE